MRPEVSFVIPVLNGAETLPQTLASIFAQTQSNYEVIVADNGSTDATLSLCATTQGVRMVSVAKLGPSAARNAGAREARGDFLAFVDCDVQLDPSWLESVLRQTQTYRLDFVATAVRPTAEDPESVVDQYRVFFARFKSHGTYLSLRKFQATAPVINTSACLCRRQSFELAGGFDEGLAHNEDLELSLRMFHRGFLLGGCSRATATVRYVGPHRTLSYLRRLFLKRLYSFTPRRPFSGFFSALFRETLSTRQLRLSTFVLVTEVISAFSYLFSFAFGIPAGERARLQELWKSTSRLKQFKVSFQAEAGLFGIARDKFLIVVDDLIYWTSPRDLQGALVREGAQLPLKKLLGNQPVSPRDIGELRDTGLFVQLGGS